METITTVIIIGIIVVGFAGALVYEFHCNKSDDENQ